MKNEGTFNIEAADGFPFSRDSKDFQQGVALMRKVLGAEDAAKVEGLIDNPCSAANWATCSPRPGAPCTPATTCRCATAPCC